MQDYPDTTGIVHCFTGTAAIAMRIIEETNLYISFSGITTFKNAPDIQEAAQVIPLDRMLIETDSPFLAPVPHRGTANQPSYVIHVAEHIAKLRTMSVEDIGIATTQNATKLLRLGA